MRLPPSGKTPCSFEVHNIQLLTIFSWNVFLHCDSFIKLAEPSERHSGNPLIVSPPTDFKYTQLYFPDPSLMVSLTSRDFLTLWLTVKSHFGVLKVPSIFTSLVQFRAASLCRPGTALGFCRRASQRRREIFSCPLYRLFAAPGSPRAGRISFLFVTTEH